MNTAQMLQKFAEGAKSACADIEVKTIRLYDLDYKGCMSCMACKIKGRTAPKQMPVVLIETLNGLPERNNSITHKI